jgi:hypothetical protein
MVRDIGPVTLPFPPVTMTTTQKGPKGLRILLPLRVRLSEVRQRGINRALFSLSHKAPLLQVAMALPEDVSCFQVTAN